MAFSFGRTPGSLSAAAGSIFRGSLGPMEAPQASTIITEQRAAPPQQPVMTSLGAGLRPISPLANHELAAPPPEASVQFTALPTYSPPSWGEYWNTPLERSGLTRAEHLYRIGSAIRDKGEMSSPTEEGIDFAPSVSRTRRGGAIGGVGGAAGRRNRRDGP